MLGAFNGNSFRNLMSLTDKSWLLTTNLLKIIDLYKSGWLQISTSSINVGLSLTINYLRMTISSTTVHFSENAVIEWNSLFPPLMAK